MKVIRTIMIFTLVFALASCGNPKGDDPPKGKEIDFTKIDKIEVKWNTYPISLSDKQMEYVISLWQEGKWSSDLWKISPDYDIKAGELDFYYDLSEGIFIDRTNDRILFLSDEQTEILNSYLTTVSVDAIAEITLGMTYSQVCQILMAPGMGSAEGSSGKGEVIYQFNCDDGSKFLISFLLDTEQKVPVVTGITKIDTEA